MIFRRVIFIIAWLIITFIFTSKAQVHIKERIELTPTDKSISTNYEPVLPTPLFNGKNAYPYYLDYGKSVKITVKLDGNIVSSEIHDTCIQSSTVSNKGTQTILQNNQFSKKVLTLKEEQTTDDGTVTIIVDSCDMDAAYNGVFVSSTGDTILPQNGILKIQISLDGWFYYVANQNEPTDIANVPLLLTYSNSIYKGTGNIFIQNKNILLGQTKYYYATSDSSCLLIHPTTSAVLPDDGDSTVTFANPVACSGSEKNPVYWESKDQDGNALPHGMIRLIGRYWEQGKTFKAVISASASGCTSATDTIEVKKPSKLGASHNTAKDVFGNSIALDDTIIKYAGLYGIPPQIIKGQIEHETNFMPAYRYEPWMNISYYNDVDAVKRYFGNANNFVVDSLGMGNGPAIPSTHTYVPHGITSPSSKNGYTTSPMKIRAYLAQYPEQYIVSKIDSFMNDDELTVFWRKTNDTVDNHYPKMKTTDKKKLSLSMTMDTLRDGIIGRKEYNQWAQTRIMASYGFIQETFYDAARDNNYFGFSYNSSTKPPEYLSDEFYGFSVYGERMYNNRKAKKNVWNGLSIHDWTNGYEKTWLNALDWYNHRESQYESSVVAASKKYLP